MQRRLLAVLGGAAAAVVVASPAAAAGPAWVTVPSPSPVATENVLTAVSARTGTDAWAVGFYKGPLEHDGRIMLAARWNGTIWTQVPTPNVRFFDEKLLAVHASGANDAWAVGSTNQTSHASTNPIAAHWDGSAWTLVPTPATTGSGRSILDGVVDFGASNAWAVGHGRNGRALVEHWDGSAWSMVANPDPVPPAGSALASVALTGLSALSPTDIWAVGSYSAVHGTTSDSFTLTEHYDGTAWKIVPSPNPAVPHPLNGARQVLNAVTVVSHNDVWAVGQTIDTASGSFFPDKTMIFHWNGTVWSRVPSPDHLSEDTLSGVAAAAANDVWAVGNFVDRGPTGADFPVGKTQILHWNGTAWTVTPSSSANDATLNSVSVVPGSAEAWTVGDILSAPSTTSTLILHHTP